MALVDDSTYVVQAAETESALAAMRVLNVDSDSSSDAQLPPQCLLPHLSHSTANVSPLVLSPSSIPPEVDTAAPPKPNKQEEEMFNLLRQKDQKIEALELNLNLYKKKLRQTEELLYELQWDPSQDMAVFNMEDRSNVESRQEKKIAQLLEQMRIMEKALREKQQVINDLSGHNPGQFFEQPISGNPDDISSPGLKGLIIASGSPANSGYLTRSGQALRRRNSTSPNQTPNHSSWLSYIPFFSSEKQATL